MNREARGFLLGLLVAAVVVLLMGVNFFVAFVAYLFRLLVQMLLGLICLAYGRRLKKKGVGRGEIWEAVGWTYIIFMAIWIFYARVVFGGSG